MGDVGEYSSNPLDQCKYAVVSSPTIDEVIFPNQSSKRFIGGPIYHTSWIAQVYELNKLYVIGSIGEKEVYLFSNAIRKRGAKPVLYKHKSHTAHVILDYRGQVRKAYFLNPPPEIDYSILDYIKTLKPEVVLVNPVFNEIPIDMALEIAKHSQWSLLDLQGYLRFYSHEEIVTTFPRKIFDVIHLSNDDLPQMEFDSYIDEISSIGKHSILYTLGEKGAVLLDTNGNPRIRAIPQQYGKPPVLGAGDVFDISYMVFLCSTWDPRKSFIEALNTATYYATNQPGLIELPSQQAK